ncbi:uncharacterized protein B0H18DRAFT_1126007 [Fomitopsis serialis]|uniref:uncharacterized protein n=1 Tax=Fomitopsis serialis TaxID=139415 RepID=UPI0020076AC3|nr:uncharacterized protein B0H18DRAFT_1126007 [Neoantrodia serialis]KAH9913768.1 hypothetical protein B0H18DRAFT_1126007 [Neoantrodia serialis]
MTSSAATDRLDDISDVLKDYPDVWLHVDAAWAGVTLPRLEYRNASRLKDGNRYAATDLHKLGAYMLLAALYSAYAQR